MSFELTRDVGDGRGPQPVSPAQQVAELHLLNRAGHGDFEPGDDPESQAFFAEVERLNPDWQPGEIPKVPAEYERMPEMTEQREQREDLIRQRGGWAYWPDGTLKADWLLVMGPERRAAQVRRGRQAMLKNRARLAQLRRDGFWFDEERRLQAPIAVPSEGRVQVAARAPRRRSVRTSGAKARAPDEPSPSGPDLAVIPLEVFRLELERVGL